jgi:hypothetical protein
MAVKLLTMPVARTDGEDEVVYNTAVGVSRPALKHGTPRGARAAPVQQRRRCRITRKTSGGPIEDNAGCTDRQ